MASRSRAGDPAWPDRFRLALDHAAAARGDGRVIACGFTGNVDRVAALDGPLLAALLAGHGPFPGRDPVVRAGTVDELLAGIVQCVRSGRGIDLPVEDPAVQQWLLRRAPGRYQVGGTGAQAAVTLDRLGFPALLHLTGRAPEQIAALGEGRLLSVAAGDGLLPADRAARPGDPVMWHVALEFAAGVPIPDAAGGGAAPAGDRVIVSHDPVNADFRIDPAFAGEVAAAGSRIPAVLISGFSQVVDPACLGRVLADAADVVGEWKRRNPGLLVHLELGAMPRADMLREVLGALAPLVSSIGLNEDELRDLARSPRERGPFGWPQRASALLHLGERLPTPRLGLHTRDGCLSLTTGDPAAEERALLFGALAAAARVRLARFPTIEDCRETLAAASIRPLPVVPAIAGGNRAMVVVPGLAVAPEAASVGLGDTFTGAVLASLSAP